MDSKKCSNKAATIVQQDLNDDSELPHCVQNPQQYNFVKMKNFASVNYVKV